MRSSLPNDPPGFVLTRRLGTGASAQVFLAEDVALGRRVALKRLTLAGPDLSMVRALTISEGRAVARLHHANIAQVYDVIPMTDSIWLVEEYVSGQSLQTLLDAHAQIPRSRAHLWIGQIALGLGAAAEAGIIHRDIKPANIMIDLDWNAKLVDFGVAANGRAGPSAIDELLEGAGTPAYLAPELVRRLPATDRIDVYALGVLAYQLYTGQHPFHEHAGDANGMMTAHVHEAPTPPNKVGIGISRSINKLIKAALAKDSRLRPSAKQFAASWMKTS